MDSPSPTQIEDLERISSIDLGPSENGTLVRFSDVEKLVDHLSNCIGVTEMELATYKTPMRSAGCSKHNPSSVRNPYCVECHKSEKGYDTPETDLMVLSGAENDDCSRAIRLCRKLEEERDCALRGNHALQMQLNAMEERKEPWT